MAAENGSATAARADERALVERLLAGDEATFTELVRRYNATLLRVARLFVNSPATAEEVVQETWLAVLRGLARFEGRSLLRTWIFRILVNRAKTRAVRDSRVVPFSALVREEVEDESVDADRFHNGITWGDDTVPGDWHEDTPEGLLLRSEVRDCIAAILDEMPPAQATVLRLRDIQGWSSREVCNELEVSETNQRVLLHRARQRVRRALEDRLGRKRLS